MCRLERFSNGIRGDKRIVLGIEKRSGGKLTCRNGEKMYSYDNSGSSLYACSGEASGSRGHMEVQGDRAGNGVYGSPSGSSSDTHEVENEDRSPRATMTSMPKRTRRQRRSNNIGGSESDNSMLLQIRRAKGEISCAECRR